MSETTSADPTPPPRRFLRSTGDDRVLGGVCAGLARYFDIDPLIVRIAAIVLAFIGGAAIIGYLAAWALVPADDGTGHPASGQASRARTITGAVLVVIAGLVLLNGAWGWGHWGVGVFFGLLPAVVIVGVLGLAGYRLLQHRGDANPTATRIVGATLLVIACCLAAAIALVGSAWATAAGGGEIIAGIVIALGVAMIALSFRHRGARWLALPALVLAIPAGVVSAAGIDVDGSIGQRTRTPATVADIPAQYKLGVGELVVDLRRMEWPRTGPVDIDVRLGTGHAVVLVPRNVCIASNATVGLGFVGVLGSESAGADLDEREGTVDRATGPTLRLKSHVGIGALEVRHDRPDEDDWSGDRGPDTGSISDALARQGCAGEIA